MTTNCMKAGERERVSVKWIDSVEKYLRQMLSKRLSVAITGIDGDAIVMGNTSWEISKM